MNRPYFVHIRNRDADSRISCKGGYTVAIVGVPEFGYSAAYARCSNKDNYCKKTGRDLAVSRLGKTPRSFTLPDDITDMKSAETYVRSLFV